MNETEQTSTQTWLSVSQAAAALGRSERTIQRQCKNGKLTARLETTADGVQWLILLEVPPLSPDSAAIVPPQVTTSFHAQNATVPPNNRKSGGSVPTGAANSDDIGAATQNNAPRVLDVKFEAKPDAREELVIELRDQVKFLRSALEARDRDAAELRAALRTALAAMPKQLTSGDQLGQLRTDVSAANARAISSQDAQEATQTGATGKQSPEAKTGARGEGLRELRAILRKIWGVR